MGDLFKNLGGGMGRENTKLQNMYVGEGANQHPLQDLLGLLAAQANQQRAQQNLMFGGAGYGGSFESKDQEAARAAGGHLNAKPYGGWGGYGSDNPVLMGKATGAPPVTPGDPGPTLPVPGDHDWVPADPRDPPETPTTGDGGTRTGSGDSDGPPGPGRGDVETAPGGVRNPAPPAGPPGGDGTVPPVRGGGPKNQDNLTTGGTNFDYRGAAPSKWDDPRMGDSFYRSEMKKQEAGQTAGNAWMDKVQSAQLSDPKIKATYDGLKALGYKNNLPDVGELSEVFSTTDLQPEDLLKHYGILIQNKGGDENRVGAGGHGAEFRNMAAALGEKLGKGLYGQPSWTTDEDAANPVQPSARPTSQFTGVAFDPVGKAGIASTNPMGYDAQQAKWDRSFGKAKTAAAAKAQTKAPPARANTFGLNIGAAPDSEMEASSVTDSRFGAAPGEGEGVGGAPPAPAANMTDTKNQDVWKAYVKMIQRNYPNMTDEQVKTKYWDLFQEGMKSDWMGESYLNNPLLKEIQSDYDKQNAIKSGNKDPERPSQFGPQGFNPTQQIDPVTGKPAVDAQGNPIYLDPSSATGQPGYAGGDAWSTSPEWRPEEPTGGLYGAYSEMAGGKLTDYENGILEGWKGRAVNPMGWADEKTLSSIDTYEKTPGRGEDEAYGAYGDMLKGGYSAAEQNAITQEGQRTARAGYETNRDAMLRNQARTNNSAGYAANMAKMARGFSETMGTQGRQNQIDFANEAQRRKEGGAAGMLNVAGLANQRGSTSIAARQGFGDELARRQETALGGQQAAAAQGRDLQKQGLAGLHALYQGSDPTASWSQAADIATKPRETYTEGGSASGGI